MKDDLSRLFEDETDDAVPAHHEQQIRAGLGALLSGDGIAPNDATKAPPQPAAPSPGAPAAASAAQGVTLKLATAVLLGMGMAAGGFALGRATAPSSPAPVAIPASTRGPVSSGEAPLATATHPVTTATPSAPPAGSEGPPTPQDSAGLPARPSAGLPARSAAATTSTASAFDREQSLLERARSALVRHDATAAEDGLDACDREFPNSRHTEERDYLRIQLLRERGDMTLARERARAFLTKYPDSLLRARVEPLTQ